MYSQYNNTHSIYGQQYPQQYFQTNPIHISGIGTGSGTANGIGIPEVTGKDTDRVPGFMGRNIGEDENVSVTLQDKELWESFSKVGTEMIITKTGRRMFPGVKIKIDGLNPEQQYCIVLDIQAVDEKRYKFTEGEWKVGGRAEPHHQRRFFIHPDSPNTGHHWTSNQVSNPFLNPLKAINGLELNSVRFIILLINEHIIITLTITVN